VPEPGRPRLRPDACLRIGADGRIADVTDAPPPDGAPLVDLSGHVLIPAPADLHAHVPQLDAVAREADGLLPWLEEHVWPAEAAFADPDRARDAARRFLRAEIRSGVTTVALYGSPHPEACEAIFQEALRLGLRVVAGPVLMDRGAPPALLRPADELLRDAERLCTNWHGRAGRLFFAWTPRFALACSTDLLAGAAEAAARTGAFVQTHLSESPAELRAVREAFPDAPDYTSVYEKAGLLGPRTLLGHCLHLSQSEWDRLAERRCAVVHCPRANFFLRSGVFPARRALRAGLRVALGSDVGAGPGFDPFQEMRAALWAAAARRSLLNEPGAALDAIEVLYMATAGAARVLAMPREFGTLEPGFSADIAALDLAPILPAGPEHGVPDAATLAAWVVYRAAASDVRAVWAAGRRIDGDG
jgi:guanine deaminase